MSNETSKLQLSRRSLIKRSAALTSSAIFAPYVLRSALAQTTGGTLVFGSNGGSTQTIFEKKIIPKFTKETGIAITYVAGQPADHVARMRAQRGTAGLDVIWLGGAVTYVAIDEGLLAPFDRSLVPNAAGIDSSIMSEPQILPVASSGNCLIYSKPVFEKNSWEPPKDWFDLWDPRFAQHTGMYGMNSTGGLEMLFQVAKELTGDYTNLDPAYAKFKELRKTIYDFFSSAGAWETALQQGNLWLAVNSYTRAIQLTQAGMPLGVVFPKTGAPSHQLPVGLVKGSQNYKAAHAWANYLLSLDTQQLIAENLGYSPTVKGVIVPDDLKALYPDPNLVWPVDWRKMSARFDRIVDRWEREVER